MIHKPTVLALSLLLSATAAFAHSDAFKPAFVDTLVGPYLSIQKGLAGDDLSAAKSGAEAYLKAMKNAPHEGKAHEEAADLRQPAEQLLKADTIAVARSQFRDLSREITPLVTHVGTTGETPLYAAHCPMAFSNEGGSWLQSDGKTVSNPYYGSMMLRCGSIQKQVAGKQASGHGDHKKEMKPKAAQGQSEHSGHQH